MFSRCQELQNFYFDVLHQMEVVRGFEVLKNKNYFWRVGLKMCIQIESKNWKKNIFEGNSSNECIPEEDFLFYNEKLE